MWILFELSIDFLLKKLNGTGDYKDYRVESWVPGTNQIQFYRSELVLDWEPSVAWDVLRGGTGRMIITGMLPADENYPVKTGCIFRAGSEAASVVAINLSGNSVSLYYKITGSSTYENLITASGNGFFVELNKPRGVSIGNTEFTNVTEFRFSAEIAANFAQVNYGVNSDVLVSRLRTAFPTCTVFYVSGEYIISGQISGTTVFYIPLVSSDSNWAPFPVDVPVRLNFG